MEEYVEVVAAAPRRDGGAKHHAVPGRSADRARGTSGCLDQDGGEIDPGREDDRALPVREVGIKPFCDGTHKRSGFSAPSAPSRPARRRSPRVAAPARSVTVRRRGAAPVGAAVRTPTRRAGAGGDGVHGQRAGGAERTSERARGSAATSEPHMSTEAICSWTASASTCSS